MSKTYSLTFGEYKKIFEELKLGKVVNVMEKLVQVHRPGDAADITTHETITEVWVERSGHTISYLLSDIGLVNTYLVGGYLTEKNDPYEVYKLISANNVPLLLFEKEIQAKAENYGLEYIKRQKDILNNYFLNISKAYFMHKQQLNSFAQPYYICNGNNARSQQENYKLADMTNEDANLAQYLYHINAIIQLLAKKELALKANKNSAKTAEESSERK